MGTGSDMPNRGKGARGAKAGRNTFGNGARPEQAGSCAFAEVAGLGATLDALVRDGDAIILGRTSDGGAYSITILCDGAKERAYPHTQDELDEAFRRIAEVYDN